LVIHPLTAEDESDDLDILAGAPKWALKGEAMPVLDDERAARTETKNDAS
jgi:hypothetical protein